LYYTSFFSWPLYYKSFFSWPLYYKSFFDLWLLFTPLASSNFSCVKRTSACSAWRIRNTTRLYERGPMGSL
jgi:hypothetical protein